MSTVQLDRPLFSQPLVLDAYFQLQKCSKIDAELRYGKFETKNLFYEKLQNLNFYIAPRSLHSYLGKSCPFKNITNRKSPIVVRAKFTEILHITFSDLNHFSLVVIYIFSGDVYKMKYRKTCFFFSIAVI